MGFSIDGNSVRASVWIAFPDSTWLRGGSRDVTQNTYWGDDTVASLGAISLITLLFLVGADSGVASRVAFRYLISTASFTYTLGLVPLCQVHGCGTYTCSLLFQCVGFLDAPSWMYLNGYPPAPLRWVLGCSFTYTLHYHLVGVVG